MDRNKEIVKVSVQGIMVNLALATFKAIVGLAANSISIILDAVNNASDILSSVVTIIGSKISAKKPDKKHPYGHGRVEYFSSIIIAVIVLAAGIVALKESIEKIIHPVRADYTAVSVLVIVVAVAVKFFFGRYVKSRGEALNSGSLIASGTDAISDSLLSSSTLVAALISMFFGISLEGYAGLLISILILRAVYEILSDTINDMIGVRADEDIIKKVREIIAANKEVIGVYDIAIHNYGPSTAIGTAHIQVRDDLTAKDIHRLTRRLAIQVYEQLGIAMTIGIYASNDSRQHSEIKKYLGEVLSEYNNLLQMHGFYIDDELSLISFDLIFSFDEENPEQCIEDIRNKMKEKFPQYEFFIIRDLDLDISE